MRMPCCTRN